MEKSKKNRNTQSARKRKSVNSLPSSTLPKAALINSNESPQELVEVRLKNKVSIKSIEVVLVSALVLLGWLFLHYNQMAAAGFIAALLSLAIMQRIQQPTGYK